MIQTLPFATLKRHLYGWSSDAGSPRCRNPQGSQYQTVFKVPEARTKPRCKYGTWQNSCWLHDGNRRASMATSKVWVILYESYNMTHFQNEEIGSSSIKVSNTTEYNKARFEMIIDSEMYPTNSFLTSFWPCWWWFLTLWKPSDQSSSLLCCWKKA